MIKVDTQPAVRELAHLTKRLSFEQYRQASARAINHTMAKVKTAANKAIRERYKIPVVQANKAMVLKRATPNNPTGMLMASSSYTALAAFQPTVTTSTGVRMVVTRQGTLASKAKRVKRVTSTQMRVEIVKGQKAVINSAFFLPGRASAVVSARGRYNDQRSFQFRTKRLSKNGADLPIDALRSVSVFKAVMTKQAQDSIGKDVLPSYRDRLLHEINRLLNV